MNTSPLSRIKDAASHYFSLGQYLVPQAEAEESIREGVSFRGMNLMILVAAIFIASLGLNTNSTAVIIGAMLISPLMGPIVGIGLGVGICDFELIKRCLRNLLLAGVFSILASTIYFLISPVSQGHSELLARTSPTIYDILIGFFGGAAGILALGSKSKGNVLPGVAIATALMPPLCTVGYGLATWQMNYFFGALYLFIINSVYIALATFLGVKAMKYKPDATVDTARSHRVRRWVYTIALIVFLPSVWMTYVMLKENSFVMRADKFVSAQFVFPSTQVLSTNAYLEHGHGVIDVTLIGRILPEDSLKLAMSSQLKNYGLEGTAINIIQGDSRTGKDNATPTSADDIFRLTQATILRQQNTIDSLKAVQAMRNGADSIGAAIAPELKVLFPQVRDIAVTRATFGSVSSGRLDTVTIAMVNLSRSIPTGPQSKFVEYLKARLRVKNIDVVNVTNEISFKQVNEAKQPDRQEQKR